MPSRRWRSCLGVALCPLRLVGAQDLTPSSVGLAAGRGCKRGLPDSTTTSSWQFWMAAARVSAEHFSTDLLRFPHQITYSAAISASEKGAQ